MLEASVVSKSSRSPAGRNNDNTDLDSTRAEHTKKETKPVLDLVSYPILLL